MKKMEKGSYPRMTAALKTTFEAGMQREKL